MWVLFIGIGLECIKGCGNVSNDEFTDLFCKNLLKRARSFSIA